MKKSAFGLMITSLIILSACAQQKPGGNPVIHYPKPIDQNGIYILPKEITLFSLGRSLSRNSVDLFDPELPTFKIPPDEPSAVDPLASFAAHPFMLIKDEDVTVFSLFSAGMPVTDGYSQEVSVPVAPPVPLTLDGGQLPP